jgi:hypothetical protein
MVESGSGISVQPQPEKSVMIFSGSSPTDLIHTSDVTTLLWVTRPKLTVGLITSSRGPAKTGTPRKIIMAMTKKMLIAFVVMLCTLRNL